MDKNNIQSILSLIVVFISLLFSVFLFTVKTRNKLANVLLGLFVLLNALDISIWFANRFMLEHLNLLMFRAGTSWLINPLFYLYALSICYSDFRLKTGHAIHAIPWVAANLAMIPRFYAAGYEAKAAFLENYSKTPEAVFTNVLGHLQFVFYIVAVFLVLRKHRKIYLENYADSGSITYNWLLQLTIIITVVHTIVMGKSIYNFVGKSSAIFTYAQIIVAINAMLVVCWFVLKALYHPALFRSVDSTIPPVENMVSAPTAGQSVEKAADAETGEKIRQLRDYMSQEEPFLEASLTVQDLANQMKMPVRELSVLINHHLDQHFFDFVNEYRIQRAMNILKDPAKRSNTIQEIFYEVGFNSKSSFNTAFKKHTGLTPTQYRSNSL